MRLTSRKRSDFSRRRDRWWPGFPPPTYTTPSGARYSPVLQCSRVVPALANRVDPATYADGCLATVSNVRYVATQPRPLLADGDPTHVSWERNGVPKQELATAEQDIGKLRRENARLREKNELLKKLSSTSQRCRREVRVYRHAARQPFGVRDVPGAAGIGRWVLRRPEPVAERPGAAPVVLGHPDSGSAHSEPPHVWGAADTRRT